MGKNKSDRDGEANTSGQVQEKLFIKRYWRLQASGKEKGGGVSLTVPDDTMSIRDIVSRYTRGQRIPDTLIRNASYDSLANFDSEDLEEVSRMDLADRDEVKQRLRKKEQEKRDFLEKRKLEEAQARASQRARAEQRSDDSSEAASQAGVSNKSGGSNRHNRTDGKPKDKATRSKAQDEGEQNPDD